MKKLLLFLILLLMVNPCFAKTMEVNKIFVDLENYLVANGNKMECVADMFYYNYKFFETYSYPSGWSKKIVADVGKSTAENAQLPEFSSSEERSAAIQFKAYYLPIFKLQYQQAYQDPNLSVKLPREAMDAGLYNAFRKDF